MTLSNVTRLLAFLFATLAPAPLFAQSGDDAAAGRALFAEARKLAAAGKYADACPKFEESLRLNRGIGTQFNLADCLERIGRTASAWGHFLEVAAAARASGQAERETVARQRAAALEPKLPRLVIEVDDQIEGLEVRRDGVLVGAAAYRTAMPVDPGKHVVVAAAPGRKGWSSELVVPAGPGTASVRVPELEREGTAPVAPAAAAAKDPPAAVDPPADEKGTGLGTERTLALAAAGVGVAGAIAGTVFFFQYKARNSDAKDICPTPASPCPPGSASTHADLVEDARKARTLTYVGWGVGAAGLAGAAVLWFTAPKDGGSERAGAWTLEPLTLPGGAGARLHARF